MEVFIDQSWYRQTTRNLLILKNHKIEIDCFVSEVKLVWKLIKLIPIPMRCGLTGMSCQFYTIILVVSFISPLPLYWSILQVCPPSMHLSVHSAQHFFLRNLKTYLSQVDGNRNILFPVIISHIFKIHRWHLVCEQVTVCRLCTAFCLPYYCLVKVGTFCIVSNRLLVLLRKNCLISKF